MNIDELRQLATEYLVPFISGAQILPGSSHSSPRQQCVAFEGPCTLAFKIARQDSERLLLRRSQAFVPDNADVVNEKRVVTAFVETLREVQGGLDATYRADLLTHLERRIACRTLSDVTFEPVLLESIDQLGIWSSRLYEGQPITCAIGFVPNDQTLSIPLRDAWKCDFSSVPTNGHDTLLTVNHRGHVVGHESLNAPNPVPSFAPYRLAPLAAWTQNGGLAVSLNRTGEILILKDQKLVFAKRSGTWHFLTPEAVVTQLERPSDQGVRTAILETSLDVSFARTGGCIGVVTSAHQNKWKQVVVSAADYLTPATSVKSMTLSRMIGGRRFQDLDRRFRQELVGIDGATVINHHGEVLAVGAILKIPGGSTGGGRLAAAKALSNLGLGMKISQDGRVGCYLDGNDEPKVSLM